MTHQCTRSHPHENMDEMCELKTEIARLTNKLTQANQDNTDLDALCQDLQEMTYTQAMRIAELEAKLAEAEKQTSVSEVEPVATKPSRIAFEHFWIKTRSKKARNDLQRHPKQPETYISDSANRHWVTWQAAHFGGHTLLDEIKHLKELVVFWQYDKDCPAKVVAELLKIEAKLAEKHCVPHGEPVAYTTGHCKEKAQPNGCQLHNLHCGYPACDRKAVVNSQPKRAVSETHKPLTDEKKVLKLKDAFYAGFDAYETPAAPYSDVDEKWSEYKAAHGITKEPL